MISTLHIKNIGIIDDISVNLNEGLNILTGETGAGKTLLVDSLGIISGERFSKEMIRSGEDHSYIEACFYLPESNIAVDGNIIVSREIYVNGRNLCKINGRMVTVSELKEFMQNIMDIHGQHDNQYLLNESTHIQYLDNFAQKEINSIKDEYKKYYQDYIAMNNELKKNYGDDIEKQRKLDLLRYQQNEIEKANLKENEEEDLESKRKIILNAEKINENLSVADFEISENAINAISTAIRSLEKIESYDETYEKQLNNLKSAYYEIQEVARDVSTLREGTYFDEEERQQVEERLDLLFSLKRKYGNTIQEILNYQKEIQEEISRIENLEEYNQKLKQELTEKKEKMQKLAIQMHTIRKEQAKQLEETINHELDDLEMKNANLSILIDYDTKEAYNENGLDQVKFLITTNIGEEAKSLSKIASGGEMSRIMLAIKNVLSNVDIVPVLIFDEIDTGISGLAAQKVGKKLKSIAKHHQVLCVTHLGSIAAKGDSHYHVYKEVIQQKTKTKIDLLSKEKRLEEIARMTSGEITKISLEHAKELIENNI